VIWGHNRENWGAQRQVSPALPGEGKHDIRNVQQVSAAVRRSPGADGRVWT